MGASGVSRFATLNVQGLDLKKLAAMDQQKGMSCSIGCVAGGRHLFDFEN